MVCQSLCFNRKLFEIDRSSFEKWHHKLIVKSQIQVTKLIYHFFLPQPKSILPISKEYNNAEVAAKILIDKASTIEKLPAYGPITAEEVFYNNLF